MYMHVTYMHVEKIFKKIWVIAQTTH